MRILSVLALVSLLLNGCTASRPIFSSSAVVQNDPLPITPRALEQLPVGRYYRMQTTDPSVAYVGQIVRADGESVELTDVDLEGRTVRKTPLLGDVPIAPIRRMFRNTGVGVQFLEGNKTLARTEIASMELLSQQQVDHRLTVKQRPPKEPAAEVEQVATQKEKETGWHAAG